VINPIKTQNGNSDKLNLLLVKFDIKIPILLKRHNWEVCERDKNKLD
jgi:hypothetical protein